MANVIHHPRFNRPKVEQTCPRRRKGTINLRLHRERRGYRLMCLSAEPKREKDQPLARLGEMVSIKVDGNIKAIRLIRALKSEGLALVEDAIVDGRQVQS